MNETGQKRSIFAYALVALVVAGVTAGVTALLININQRKAEARSTYVKLVEVTENDVDPAKWGVNFPRQYDGYKRTSETTHTKYGGGAGGAESAPPPQKSARDPWLTRVFSGYLFSIDYRDRRGHAFMLQDQESTKRNVPAENKQSGNCLHCHGSIIPLYRKLGAEAAPRPAPTSSSTRGSRRSAP